jgi:hypothetical protein
MTGATPPEVTKSKSVAAWVFGWLAFIPALGILFGIIAIIMGAVKRMKGPIYLGLGGIAFTFFVYGNLYYWGAVATNGPYAALKVQLTQQLMSTDAGQIALYKNQHGTLPTTLDDVAASSSITAMFTPMDAWETTFNYTPQKDGHFQIVSAGPDKTFGTSDDIQEAY